MAVEIEFANVIIRKAAMEKKYPGGLDAFAATELPNYIEDDNLARVGFMSSGAAQKLVVSLTQLGLISDNTPQSEVAIVERDRCPDWLIIRPIKNSTGCWLAGSNPGNLVNCKNGFLLRCPRDLFGQLEIALESYKIDVNRSEPQPAEQKDFMQVVCFSRNNAFIEAKVIGDKSGSRPVGLWASRDLSRRQSCADDIRLAAEIEAVLLAQGAKNK